MPSLNWIGKEKIVNHDKDVPFRLMRKNKKYSLGESENLILEGDNLEALKALMPFYYGKIKCIYIDPPYNTGNEKWVYNDKVNSPKIKEWLGKVVGPEGEDLTRHDKWLCMMYPRLKLLYELLNDCGLIFISINDYELQNLLFLVNEIFGEKNVELMIWHKIPEEGTAGQGKMKITHRFRLDNEYIVVCYKNKDSVKFNKPLRIKKVKNNYGNIDNDSRGDWMSCEICKSEIKSNPSGKNYYSIKTPLGRIIKRQWHVSYDEFLELDKAKKIYWGSGKSVPRLKKFLNEPMPITPSSVITNISQTEANTELKQLLGEKKFDNPKPHNLIKWLLEIGSKKGDIILDSFAGSGTTAHAVLDLNKEDGGNRKFILVEMEKNIAKNITAERVKRVAKGYSYKNGKGKVTKVAGLSGGFEYVELGDSLFDKDGMINKAVSFEDMARYVYFTETRTNLEKKNIKGNYLGEFSGCHYFLLFNGIDKNILDRKFIKALKPFTGKKVVYADKCLLDEKVLEKYQIVFKQIPYAVKVY